MSKMSRQERLAYEQALKKRKKQGSSTKKRNSQLPQYDENVRQTFQESVYRLRWQ